MTEEDIPQKIIQHFLDQNASIEELSTLIEWLKESPANKRLFDVYNEVWHLNSARSGNYPFHVDAHWKALDQQISVGHKETKVASIKSLHLSVLKVAATVAIFIGLAFSWLYFQKVAADLPAEQWVKVEAPAGERSKMMLEDGTVIWLNSESELKYRLVDNKRMVHLSGEAYFQVARNENIPFIVCVEDVEVKVLGTQFNISAYLDEKTIKTTLLEGSVGIKTLEHEAILIPGQQAIVNKGQSQIYIEDVDTGLEIIWQNNILKFRNTPLGEVVKKLERWYDVSISADEQLLKTERYTMTIKTESLNEVMERMQLITNIDYQIEGDQVKIIKR